MLPTESYKWKNPELKRIFDELNNLIKAIHLSSADGLKENSDRVVQLTRLLHLQSSLLRLDQGEKRLNYQLSIALISSGVSLLVNGIFMFFFN